MLGNVAFSQTTFSASAGFFYNVNFSDSATTTGGNAGAVNFLCVVASSGYGAPDYGVYGYGLSGTDTSISDLVVGAAPVSVFVDISDSMSVADTAVSSATFTTDAVENAQVAGEARVLSEVNSQVSAAVGVVGTGGVAITAAVVVSEVVNSSDDTVGVVAFNTALNETTFVLDTTSFLFETNAVVDESLEATDEYGNKLSLYSSVNESIVGNENAFSRVNVNGLIVEELDVYDTANGFVVFTVLVLAALTARDQITARLLWELIPDAQNPAWQAINSSVDGEWALVEDVQPNIWQNINSSTTSGWGVVDTDEAADWQKINTI